MWLRYVPEGLLLLLQYIQRTYAVPVMVTENGCADVVGAQVHHVCFRGMRAACMKPILGSESRSTE